jgi:hypothetical protein
MQEREGEWDQHSEGGERERGKEKGEGRRMKKVIKRSPVKGRKGGGRERRGGGVEREREGA